MKNGLSKESVIQIVREVLPKLNGLQYAIRGTASLCLQGIDVRIGDIDIVCDPKCALMVNELYKENITKNVTYSESPLFKSYFGEFRINGIKIEVMGNFQIKTSEGCWSSIYKAEYNQVDYISIENLIVPVTKLSTELKMYTEMGRFNVYNKVRDQLEKVIKPVYY